MDPNRFIKVFDILDVGFQTWIMVAGGLLFVALGLAQILLAIIVRFSGIRVLDYRAARTIINGSFTVVFGVLFTAIFYSLTYPPYERLKALAEHGQCRLIQGPVESFVAPSQPARPEESFGVGGVTFRYSDNVHTNGFNNTSAQGGPVRAGQYVRICYDPLRNVILRLEIRDFAGELKNYAQGLSLFPKAHTRGAEPSSSIQWLTSLIVLLCMLHVFAVLRLFLPYLRLFIRIKTAALPDIAIPDRLAPDARIKLGNSVVYWDRHAHAIWLRPRGLNLLRLPGTVAKLNVDPGEPTIIGGEIHLSPVMPLVTAAMILFFFLAIPEPFVAATVPRLSFEFLLIPGVMIAIFAFLGLRDARTRMDALVLDALHDIRHRRLPDGT